MPFKRASQLMTEDLGQNLTILTDKLEALYKQIETSGKVVDFLENHDVSMQVVVHIR